MNVDSAVQTYIVPERFDRALKSIRAALRDVELEIVDEVQVSDNGRSALERRFSDARILLIGCPILDFEAMALGRAAAVFFPLHVLVSAEPEQTRVFVVNPTTLFAGRLPMGASEPLNRLVARISLALDSLQRPDGQFK